MRSYRTASGGGTDDGMISAQGDDAAMGPSEPIAAPAAHQPAIRRARSLRIAMAGLCAGALIGLVGATAAAQAATCSGTMGLTMNSRGREVPTLSFRCDTRIGGGYPGRLFEVTFGDPNLTTINDVLAGRQYLDSPALDGQCETMATPAGGDPFKSYVSCASNSGATIGPGTTITGTPWSAADRPACPRSAVVTVYGSDDAPLASLPLTDTCPAHWIIRNTLTIAVFGAGTVTGNGIGCRGSCTYLYPEGTRVSLTADPAPGATFVGWGDECRGTARGCTVTLDEDSTVAATFLARSTSAGPLRLSVDRAPRISGTTVSMQLGCHGPARTRCTVLAALATKGRRPVTVARRRVSMPTGAQATISLPLSPAGRALLRRSRTLPTRLTVSLTGTAGSTLVFATTVTFKRY